jgi:hypothetical protein
MSLKIQSEQTENNSELGLVMLAVDLKQDLPTPKLSCRPTIYKCKLWTYSFSIQSYVSDQRYIFMWNEATANRGSDEIGSCILKFIEIFPHNFKYSVIF